MSTPLSTSRPAAARVVHAADPQAREWWRSAVIYQVYPRSFADGDGDGMGDLRGITGRLDHLAELGVDALWLSPFYRSPQVDGGYDVADYRAVDPLFGSLEDFDRLRERAKSLGLRVIVDLVPNHTSDEHEWFAAALAAGPGAPERERYVFRDGRGERGEEPPNNWQSIFGGPAWTRVSTRADARPGDEQWYLHLFDTRQPDLNWELPEVRAEFEDILRFWLDRGVDGFRIDVAHGMIKAPGLPDWDGEVTMIEGSHAEDSVSGSGNQGPMFDQDRVHEIYRAWHAVLSEYDGDRALVAEAWVEPLSRLARYVRPDEMQQAFNFSFLSAPWTPAALRSVIAASFAANDHVGAPTTWVLSNHDTVRHTSRLGLQEPNRRPNGIAAGDEQPDEELGLRRGRAATAMMLAFPGSAYLYQGEELGLPDHTRLEDSYRQDPAWWRSGHTEAGRDGCRVPLPWSSTEPGHGFGPTGRTWLPQPPSFARYALDVQRGVEGSTYELYRRALRLRREHDLGLGSLTWAEDWAESDQVVAFENSGLLVLSNLGPDAVALPAGAELLLASGDTTTDADGTVRVPADVCVWARLV